MTFDEFERSLVIGQRVNVRGPILRDVLGDLPRTVTKVERKRDTKGREWLYWHWTPEGQIEGADGRPFTDCGYSGVCIEGAERLESK